MKFSGVVIYRAPRPKPPKGGQGDLEERQRPPGRGGRDAARLSPKRPTKYSLGVESNRAACGHPARPARWTGRGRRAAVLPPPFTSRKPRYARQLQHGLHARRAGMTALCALAFKSRRSRSVIRPYFGMPPEAAISSAITRTSASADPPTAAGCAGGGASPGDMAVTVTRLWAYCPGERLLSVRQYAVPAGCYPHVHSRHLSKGVVCSVMPAR